MAQKFNLAIFFCFLGGVTAQFVGCTNENVNHNKPVAANIDSLSTASYHPDNRPKLSLKDWLGTYSGTLKMYNLSNPDSPHNVAIQIEIDTTADKNKWIWRSSYKSTFYGDQLKDYKLIQPDSFIGTPRYWTDENDDLLLHNSYFDNTFYNSYQVNNNYINRVFKLYKNELFYDIFTSNSNPIKTKNMKEISIQSFSVISSQSAVLKKIK